MTYIENYNSLNDTKKKTTFTSLCFGIHKGCVFKQATDKELGFINDPNISVHFPENPIKMSFLKKVHIKYSKVLAPLAAVGCSV